MEANESTPTRQPPICPDCEAAAPLEASARREPEPITDVDRVRNYEGVEQHTDFRHHVDKHAVLATFRVNQTVSCSQGHSPKEGLIAQARCKRILRLGWRCAERALTGMAELHEAQAADAAYFNQIADLKRIPGECISALLVLTPQLIEFTARKKRESGLTVTIAMRKRARQGPSGREVLSTLRRTTVTRFGELRDKPETFAQQLRGLNVLLRDLDEDATEAKRLRDLAATLFDEALSPESLSEGERRELLNACRDLEREIRPLKTAHEDCLAYWSQANQHLANQSLKLGGKK